MSTDNTGTVNKLRRQVHEAAYDYRWLLDRGYPDQPSIKLVGDHYQLTGTERAMLFRGVFSERDSERRARLLRAACDRPSAENPIPLLVDGHNVLFTVWNYLNGRPVVRGTDGFVRDIGGTHTRLPHGERFTRLAELLCEGVRRLRFRHVTVLLDDPLPWSREHRGAIEEMWAALTTVAAAATPVLPHDSGAPSISFTVRTEPHVDATVAGVTETVIATSDTGIINRCDAPVLDLGGYIVTQIFGAVPATVLE